MSGDESSIESEDFIIKPLAKLLQNVGSVTQSTPANPGQRKKLRPEVIDVHRIKDVGTAQTVSLGNSLLRSWLISSSLP